jgi:hypothetical protein
MKPLSSAKTRWALSFLAFFYMPPFTQLPLLDGSLIALTSLLLWLLAAPAHASKHSAYVVGPEFNGELALHQLSDALLGPQLCSKAIILGTLQKQLGQLLLLFGVQLGWPAWYWQCLERLFALGFKLLLPGIHGTDRTTKLGRYFRRLQAFSQQRYGALPSLL